MNTLTLPGIFSYVVSTGLVASTFFLENRWVFYLACLLSIFLVVKVSNNSRSSRNRKVLDPNDYQELTLQEKTAITQNTSIYRFKLPRPTDILGLPTGQHISLCATVKGEPRDVVRSYTPISSDHEAGHIDLLVKSYPTGRMSKYLEGMQLGQAIKVRGPKGAMTYTPNMCRHIGMIAGGTGITPMYQVIKEVNRNRPLKGGHDITILDLIFANVDEKDILLKKELDELASGDDRFHVHYTLNKPPPRWSGSTGFVTTDMIKKNLPAPAADVKILLCGPPQMIAAMKAALESLGYTKARPVSKLADQVFCF